MPALDDDPRRGRLAGSPLDTPNGIDLARIIDVFRLRWPLIVSVALACLVLATAYAVLATPRYMAATRILIDTRKNQLLQNQQVLGDQQVDAGVVESQVEIVKSEDVAQQVVRDLNLAADPEFSGHRRGVIGALTGSIAAAISFFVGSEEKTLDAEHVAMDILGNNLAVKRVGMTYVIEIDYTALSPRRAAQVANAIADAYLAGELAANYAATRRASTWLQDRIGELRRQAADADRALQSFKAENNIVDTSRGLMSEQQLADLNSQIVLSRAAMAEAKARRDRILEVVGNDKIPDASVSDALKNDVITRLRAQYLDLAAREHDLGARYGKTHVAVVNLRNQMAEVRGSIASEMNRIAESYKSDYEIAQARNHSLQDSLEQLLQDNSTGGKARVKLNDLESSAQNYRTLYDSFLQKWTEATQQQTFPISAARVITRASEPGAPAAPKKPLVIVGSLLAGLCLGFGLAFARDSVNTGFQTADAVERLTGLACLGILPIVPKWGDSAGATGLTPFAVQSPFSRFAETLRNVKISIDLARLGRETKIIGITSALPKEGKSTVAANLAQLIAHAGHKTLLVDADLRVPTLSRLMAPRALVGMLDVLSGDETLEQAVRIDRETGLHFLPAVVPARMSSASEILACTAMGQLLAEARDLYDYVFLDFAPVGPVVDVRAASHRIDSFVFVIEWGSTSRKSVREALASTEGLADRILGVVLNRADPITLKRLEAHKGKTYQSDYIDTASAA